MINNDPRPAILDRAIAPLLAMTDDEFHSLIASDIRALAADIAEHYNYFSDSTIDSHNAAMRTLTALNAILYCDDFTRESMRDAFLDIDIADLITDIDLAEYASPFFDALDIDDPDEFLDSLHD